MVCCIALDICVLFINYYANGKLRGYAIQHIPVPVSSQDKLGGLRQEGHRRKNRGINGAEKDMMMIGWWVGECFFYYCLTRVVWDKGP